MKLHLHHVQHMNSHLLNEYLRNPRMATTQQRQRLNMEDTLRMPPMKPGTAQRPNLVQYPSSMSQPLPHNMKQRCKSDQGMLNKNNGRCMADLLRMDPTSPMNLQGKVKSLHRCSNSQGTLVYRELIGRAIARLSLRPFRVHRVNSTLQGEIRLLRTNLARYSAVLVDLELWAFLVH
jgi:hypothetical protein